MAKMQRMGVSIEEDLLEAFDRVIEHQGYENRSEAIRDLIRRKLDHERLSDPDTKGMAAVLIVYDHHLPNVGRKLTKLQHSQLLETVCSMHVHMDEHYCLEVIILKGKLSDIAKTGHEIISTKGVKLGKVNLVSGQR